jgi:hypothetical protein
MPGKAWQWHHLIFSSNGLTNQSSDIWPCRTSRMLRLCQSTIIWLNLSGEVTAVPHLPAAVTATATKVSPTLHSQQSQNPSAPKPSKLATEWNLPMAFLHLALNCSLSIEPRSPEERTPWLNQFPSTLSTSYELLSCPWKQKIDKRLLVMTENKLATWRCHSCEDISYHMHYRSTM